MYHDICFSVYWLTARQSSAREGSVGFKTARHAFSDRKAASSQPAGHRQKTQTRQPPNKDSKTLVLV